MRGFDGVIYLVVFIALVVLTNAVGGGGERRPPTYDPRVRFEEGGSLPPPSARDPRVHVAIPYDVSSGSGTAFAIGDGLWMTARHVVDGCGRLVLVDNRRRGYRVERLEVSPDADVAVFRAALEREPLPLALNPQSLTMGAAGYMVGYPQGRPGEVLGRLMGRELLVVQGRYRTREPVIAWAEVGRTFGLRGGLGGISGGPAFDSQGNVVGITVAESPRRGRVYTAAPRSLRTMVLRSAAAAPENARPAGAFSPQTYGEPSDALRQASRVARVLCQPG